MGEVFQDNAYHYVSGCTFIGYLGLRYTSFYLFHITQGNQGKRKQSLPQQTLPTLKVHNCGSRH